jgi:hypothetical protein
MVDLVAEIPTEHEFKCCSCGKSCMLYPKGKPMSVQHAEPVCALWKRIEGQPKQLSHFLINSGVPINILPQA